MATEFNIDYDKQTIIWTKWYNPFSNDEIKEILRKLKKQHQQEEGEEDEKEELELPTPVKVAFHPVLGLLPITDYAEPDKIFNFWLGHTNFTITSDLVDLIQKVEGVEILDILTRYRFRIGIGQAFKDSNVLIRISAALTSRKGKFDNLRTIIEEAKKKVEEKSEPPPNPEEKGV